MEKKRVLLNVTTIPVFIKAQEVPVTELHSDDIVLNKFLLENRVSLPERIEGFAYKQETVVAARYGNTENVSKINTNEDALTRKIQLFSAECEISDYKLHGRVCACPKLSIQVEKQDGELQGSLNFAYQVAGGLEHSSATKMTAERMKQKDEQLIARAANQASSTEEGSSSNTQSEDMGGKEEGEDDIDCQEQKDAELKNREEWDKIDEELQYRDKQEENMLANKSKRLRQ